MLTNGKRTERTLTHLQRGAPTINRSYSAAMILRVDGWQGARFCEAAARLATITFLPRCGCRSLLRQEAGLQAKTNWTELRRCPDCFRRTPTATCPDAVSLAGGGRHDWANPRLPKLTSFEALPSAPEAAGVRSLGTRLAELGNSESPQLRAVSGSKALSAGPPAPAQILPGTAINVALGIQSFRTRVFRGVELKDHPLRIRDARIGRRVQKPDFLF
jgi:hypothetical protein